MTSIGDGRQGEHRDEEERRAQAAWDVAWVAGHGLDELLRAYARLVLGLSRARAVTVGSRHRLPERALRHWSTALELAGRAERLLAGGCAELRQLPGVAPIGGAGEVAVALRETVDEVRAGAIGLVELRDRIDTATAGELGDTLPAAALSRLREGVGALDELTVRIQQGCAALGAYTDGVFGVDLMPGRTARAVALAQASWHPPDNVGMGVELAGRFVARAASRADDVPAQLRVPLHRRLAWRAGRGFRAVGGSRLFRPRTAAAFFDDCLRALLLLTRGNTIWYADRLRLFRRAGVFDGYADALAAAVVVAVDRRLGRRGDDETVRRLAARMHDRYDGGTREVPPDAAEGLIRAALGETSPPAADPVRLNLLQTLLVVDLLADERLNRTDRAVFRGETVELALTIGPARLATAEPTDREPTDRERNCDG